MRLLLHANWGDGGWDAFATGCQTAGHRVVWQRPGVWTPSCLDRRADVAVVHGLSGNAGAIHAHYRARGVPVWIVDLPRLREELDAIGFYLNSLHWLPADAVRRVVAPKKLKQRTPDIALVVGQKPDDHAHGMDADGVARWARETVTLARTTGLPVVYRAHPLSRHVLPADAFGADAVSPTTTPIADEFPRTAVVVTHNSTAGWEAIAAGVPVHATDDGAAYAPYTTPLTD
ncbi:MAG TPA: hypothetical protein VFM71_00470, partial [Gemmatimonadaceae bacterium]|nr:hypothetical protein [Gemmatimonadaceae bacterium]